MAAAMLVRQRTMAQKIRMGFIGIGAMGFSHLELFHKDCGKKAEAVAFCARNKERIAAAREIAPDMELFKKEVDLIRSDLDAVVVSSRTFPLPWKHSRRASISFWKSRLE